MQFKRVKGNFKPKKAVKLIILASPQPIAWKEASNGYVFINHNIWYRAFVDL